MRSPCRTPDKALSNCGSSAPRETNSRSYNSVFRCLLKVHFEGLQPTHLTNGGFEAQEENVHGKFRAEVGTVLY